MASAAQTTFVSRLVLLSLALLLASTTAAHATWAVGLTTSSSAQTAARSAPATPTGATSACTSALAATVKITWNPASLATSYTVWQSTTSATSGYTVAATGISGTTWTSGNLATGSYWFEVSAATGTNWTSPNSTATAKRTIVVATCA